MTLDFDLDVGALYIRLSGNDVALTQEIDDNTSLDLDASGGLVGIEVISIRQPWPLSQILADYRVPANEKAQLKAYFSLPEDDDDASHTAPPQMPAPLMVTAEPALAAA